MNSASCSQMSSSWKWPNLKGFVCAHQSMQQGEVRSLLFEFFLIKPEPLIGFVCWLETVQVITITDNK